MVCNRDNGLFIKGSALLGSERGVGRQIDESQCVSVRFGFGEFRPADFSVSPGFVFDDQGLAYILLGTVGQQTRACIRTGTGFISDNNLLRLFPVSRRQNCFSCRCPWNRRIRREGYLRRLPLRRAQPISFHD